jgi:hypothetical protein
MARDEAAREHGEGESLLDRRSYLQLAGAAAASVASFGTTTAAKQDDNLFLSEDFESKDYRDNFTFTYDMLDERTTGPVRSGDHALNVRFPKGSHDGMTAWCDPVEAGLRDQPARDLYATYWVRFPSDFEGHPHGGKLPGPMNYFEDWSQTDGNGDGHGGDPSTGYGWSARGNFKDSDANSIVVGAYVYHMDMGGQYGDNWGKTSIAKEEWHRVTQHVKLNTASNDSANADGVLEWWIDDQKVIDQYDMRWTNHPEEGVKYAFTTWYGGKDPSPKDQDIYFDSWQLSTAPIPGTPPAGDAHQTTTSQDSTDSQGTVLELETVDGADLSSYEFTVDGSVSKRTDAGDLAAEGNDEISANDDGTTTVTGAAGDGYGDSYYVNGDVTAIDIAEDKWTIRYDGEEVSAAELIDGNTDQQLSNTLVIDGNDKPNSVSTYTFQVSGDVAKSAELGSINSYDQATDGEISGRVVGGKDGYRFSGEITGFSLDGPATVRVEDGS